MTFFKRALSVFVGGISLLTASSAFGIVVKKQLTELTENFAQNSNDGQWELSIPHDILEDSNKFFMYVTGLDTYSPQLYTTSRENIFTGNYTDKKVKSIGVSTKIFQASWIIDTERPLTLVLISGDAAAYKTSDKPLVRSLNRWESYQFDISKTAQEAREQGWVTTSWPNMDGNGKHGNYDDIIKKVDQVNFYYGDPALFYLFQMWSVGATDIRIVQDNEGRV